MFIPYWYVILSNNYNAFINYLKINIIHHETFDEETNSEVFAHW